MAKSVCEVLLTEMPLVVPEQSASLETGAIVDFWGIVRLTEQGVPLTGINYEAYPAMAEHQLRLVAEEACRSFAITQIRIKHRLGFVAVGQASLFVRVGSRHRAEAFRGGDWIVSELKKRVPIWKHPRLQENASKVEGDARNSTETSSR